MVDLSVFGLERVTTEFFVNEEARTVACVITTINDIPHRLAKYGLADDDYGYDDFDAFDVRTYRGVAKCSPEDKWDENYGKHLAEYRAAKARKNDVNNELKKYVRGIDKCINKLIRYGFMKEPHYPMNEAQNRFN